MSPNDKVLPPGKPLSSNQFKVEKLKNNSITFSFNSTSIRPLSPVVQASIDNGELQVSAIVFIPSSIKKPKLDFVSKKHIVLYSGEDQLNIYIAYDAKEVYSQTFDAYKVDIIIDNPPRNLIRTQTFLWDEDPIGSRGTETTVDEG